MKIHALLITSLLCGAVMGVSPFSAPAQDDADQNNPAQNNPAPAAAAKETKAPDQPFAHPSNDASYSRNVKEDKRGGKAEATDNGSVRFVSGGVGDGGMQAMDSQQENYNLKLTFVAQGEYLADVNVNMTDGKGNSVLVTKTEGPVLLVNTPPGHYTVVAQDAAGSTLRKRIQVGRNHIASYVFRYPDITND